MFDCLKRERKVKKPVVDHLKIAIDNFRSFRGVGERFKYLGVEMIVTSHCKTEFTGVKNITYALLTCDYKNDIGEIKLISFSPSELNTLIAENT
tara:strand:- start:16 stop:297 length:282 start_codon:yes stop_codon:yes gene_type:complete